MNQSLPAPGNRLGDETSPYLLQHRENPVHWLAWGDEAFQRATAEDKPVLLSVGYAACHWCHVMAHESFEDEAIAAQINRDFIAVKVDREERPDIDHVYQQALVLLQEPGGWPLTMFLTPDRRPFWGGTYFPPAPRYGRPSLPQVLDQLARMWREERPRLLEAAGQLHGGLQRLAAPPKAEAEDSGFTPALLLQIARQRVRELDPFDGGFGDAPKFPHFRNLELLWCAYVQTGKRPFADGVIRGLTAMLEGGIWDHLGGGLARYSVDAHWLVPHFEKMLYDQAGLLELLAAVHAVEPAPLWAARADELVGFLEREMLVTDGAGRPLGYAAALDADSLDAAGHLHEGAFYVWDAAEIDAVLGPDAAAFKAAYGVTEGGNWEGRTILNRSQAPGWRGREEEAHLARLCHRLLAARAGRVRPQRDDKVLADWNGLILAALVRAGAAFDRWPWVRLAAERFETALAALRGADGGLAHSFAGGRAAHPATLEDHANLARAGLLLAEATGEARFLEAAAALADRVLAGYADPATGSFFMTAGAGEGLPQRPRLLLDNPTPAGNGTMVEVLGRLHLATGTMAYAEAADRLLLAQAPLAARQSFGLTTGLLAARYVMEPVQIVLALPPGAPAEAVAAFARVALRAAAAQPLVLERVVDGQSLPPGHPAAGKASFGGQVTAYICRGPVCQPPLTIPEALEQALNVQALHQ